MVVGDPPNHPKPWEWWAVVRAKSATVPWALLCLGGLFTILVLTRLAGLNLSLELDEVFTVVSYVDRGPEGIWLGEYEPNDHVFFNLVTWLTTSAIGKSDALYRVWGVVPAIAATGILARWSWCRLGRWVSVVTVFLATTAPLYLKYHPEARGYGLTMLAAVLMIVAADRLLHGEATRRRWVAFAGAAVLGIWTHIAFLIGYLAQAVILLPFARLRRATLVTGVAVALVSAAFYGPLIGQMVTDLNKYYGKAPPRTTQPEYASSDGVAFQAPIAQSTAKLPPRPPLPWHAALTGPSTLVASGAEVMIRGDYKESCVARCYEGDRLGFVALILVFWGIGGVALWMSGRRRLWLLLAGPPALTFLILSLPQGFVADRFVSYTVPYTLVLTAVGIVSIVQFITTVRVIRPLVVATVGVVALLGLLQFSQLANNWTQVPFENYKTTSAIAEGADSERIVTNSERPLGFFHYLGRRNVAVMEPAALEQMFCQIPGPYVFIFHPVRADAINMSCLQRREAARVRVDQRGRGGYMDVYFVTGAPPRS